MIETCPILNIPRILVYIFAVLFLLSLVSPLFSQDSTKTTGEIFVIWDPNTEPDLAGYNVFLGLKSVANGDTSAYKIKINNGLVVGNTWTSLAFGKTYYMTATAYDSSGNESRYGNEVSHFFKFPDIVVPQDTIPPGPPDEVKISKISITTVIEIKN